MAKYTPKTKDELKELVQDSSIYLGDIDTSNITNMLGLFFKSARRDFSGIESWDTSNVTDMRGMFGNASYFNHNINSWDTSRVVAMSDMFNMAERFNQPLNNWDTSSVVNMSGMFNGAKSFNQPLDSWDTSKVVDMSQMFLCARLFNQPLNSWDTYNVVSMYGMFCGAEKFNQPLDNWDTSGVEIMTNMFVRALKFNQNINSWDISSVRDNQDMFAGSGMRRMPKWYKNTQFFSDLDNYDDMNAEIERLVKEAIANPRPKKPKIAPQDKPQSNSVNDLISTWFGFDSSKPPSKGKAILSVIVLIAIFAIFRIIDKSEDSQNNNKATTQPTQTAQLTQQQSAQQPAQNTLRCDDSGLLNHLIKTYKNFLVDVYQDADLFTKWQGYYQQQGINVTSAEEIVNSFKHNIINVQTKTNDEVNRQITCEVEIEEVHPIPQYKPYYSILDYRAQIADNNRINFGILKIRSIDK